MIVEVVGVHEIESTQWLSVRSASVASTAACRIEARKKTPKTTWPVWESPKQLMSCFWFKSGRSNLKTPIFLASVPGAGPQGLNPRPLRIAERLKELGYVTQYHDKWHLGDQPEFLPTKQGFDRYLGIA